MKKLFILFALAFCTSFSFAEVTVRPQAWATPVNAEANLFQITPTLFRSEQLITDDLPLIKQLDIKTVISFRAFHSDEKHLKGQPVNLIRIPIMTWNISDKQVAEALWQIEQSQKEGAVLIHCMHGADRTGLIAAMYRIIYQNWDIDEAKRELMEGGYGYHSMWKNIEGFFTQEHVDHIKKLLSEKQNQASSLKSM